MAVPGQVRLGALQIGASSDGTAATLDRLMAYRQELEDSRLDVLVLPEALLGGYPKGADFGARLGYRTSDGREAYLDYWSQAVELDGATWVVATQWHPEDNAVSDAEQQSVFDELVRQAAAAETARR